MSFVNHPDEKARGESAGGSHLQRSFGFGLAPHEPKKTRSLSSQACGRPGLELATPPSRAHHCSEEKSKPAPRPSHERLHEAGRHRRPEPVCLKTAESEPPANEWWVGGASKPKPPEGQSGEASEQRVPVVSSSFYDYGLQGHYDDISSDHHSDSRLPAREAGAGHEKYRYTVNHVEDTENYRFNEWTSPYFKPAQTYNYFCSSNEQIDELVAGNYRFRKANNQGIYDKWVSKQESSAAATSKQACSKPADPDCPKVSGQKKKKPRKPPQPRTDNFGYLERKHFPTDDSGKKVPTIFRPRYYFVLSERQPEPGPSGTTPA